MRSLLSISAESVIVDDPAPAAPLGLPASAAGRRQLLTETERAMRRLAALRARLVAAADAARDWHADEAASPTAWLVEVLGTSTPEAAAVRRLAELVAEHPLIAERLHAGALGTAQADTLARTYAQRALRAELAVLAEALLTIAERTTYDDFAHRLGEWERLAEPPRLSVAS